jgi:hypothetical protein
MEWMKAGDPGQHRIINFRGDERPGREADRSPPSSAEVKEWVELYLHSHNTPSWRGAQFKKKAQGQLYLYFYAVMREE